MAEPTVAPLNYTPEQARAALGIGRTLLFEWMRDPTFPRFKPSPASRLVLIPVAQLEAWNADRVRRQVEERTDRADELAHRRALVQRARANRPKASGRKRA